MPPLHILIGPPFQKRRKALVRGIDRPIKLGSKIIDPAAGEPLSRICVEPRVGVETSDLRRINRTPDPERADSEFHPRLRRLDGVVHPTNKPVDVFTPPIAPAQAAACAEPLPTRVIR